MHTQVAEALETYEIGRAAARIVASDADLSDAAKARIARETRQLYADEARTNLTRALTASQKRQQAAAAALLAAQRMAGNTPDVQRRILMAERVRAAENDRERLTAIVLETVRQGNADDLAAVNDFALPRLAKLQTVPDGTPAGDRLRPGTFKLLEAQVGRAIAETESPELSDARLELAAADGDLAELTGDLRRVNMRYAETMGGRGPFGDILDTGPGQITTTGGPGLPGPWVITGGAL